MISVFTIRSAAQLYPVHEHAASAVLRGASTAVSRRTEDHCRNEHEYREASLR
jgi:hypothetical protein